MMKINRCKRNSRLARAVLCAALVWFAFLSSFRSVYAEGEYEVTEMRMQGTITSDSSLNVRSGPGTEYDVITKAGKDVVLTITGQADNGWYQVEIDGKTGFVSDQYVEAAAVEEEEAVEPEKEIGEPEEGYRGLHQSPFVIKMTVIVAVLVVVVCMIVVTLKGLHKDEEDDDDDESDDEEDESGSSEDDTEDEDGSGRKRSAGHRRSNKRHDTGEAVERHGKAVKKSGKKAYVLREEDYRIQIDPSFFEDREPIEQPAMVTGYLERKKIEEAAERARAEEEAAGKQRELDHAMEKLSELQREIERLKKQE